MKKILISLGLHAPLRNAFEAIKNTLRYKKILRKNIRSVLENKRRFGYETFIETGTHRGNMLEGVKGHFKNIYSIELGEDLYKKAKKRFAEDRHIKLFKGDSAVVLPELLKELRQPALFWLDAHYSTGDTARGEIDTPIERELEAVLNHPIKNHVILIDDARCFDGKNGYPTAAEIQKIALSHNYLFEIKDDSFRFYPREI